MRRSSKNQRPHSSLLKHFEKRLSQFELRELVELPMELQPALMVLSEVLAHKALEYCFSNQNETVPSRWRSLSAKGQNLFERANQIPILEEIGLKLCRYEDVLSLVTSSLSSTGTSLVFLVALEGYLNQVNLPTVVEAPFSTEFVVEISLQPQEEHLPVLQDHQIYRRVYLDLQVS